MCLLKPFRVLLPCVIGPHAMLAAPLSIKQYSYRVSAAASKADGYMTASISDQSLRTDAVPISGVALLWGFQDVGIFDLAFGAPCNGRHGPLECAVMGPNMPVGPSLMTRLIVF